MLSQFPDPSSCPGNRLNEVEPSLPHALHTCHSFKQNDTTFVKYSTKLKWCWTFTYTWTHRAIILNDKNWIHYWWVNGRIFKLKTVYFGGFRELMFVCKCQELDSGSSFQSYVPVFEREIMCTMYASILQAIQPIQYPWSAVKDISCLSSLSWVTGPSNMGRPGTEGLLLPPSIQVGKAEVKHWVCSLVSGNADLALRKN